MGIIKFGSYLILISIFALVAQPALADSSATVAATVQTELVSLTTSVSSLDYGSLGFGASKTHDTEISVTNNGNVSEKIEIKGDDAVERSDHSKVWRIDGSYAAGLNTYKHLFEVAVTGQAALTKNYYRLITGAVAPAGSIDNVSLTINTPTAGSYGGTFETTVSFMATKYTDI